MTQLQQLGKRAKRASVQLLQVTEEEKKEALQTMARHLRDKESFLVKENEKDIVHARENGVDEAIIDRLLLNQERLKDIADAVDAISLLPNPLGEVIEEMTHDNGLQITRQRVPLGVVGMVYEARPNVTVDAAALALKTSNAIILRGSSSALHSNKALVSVMQEALRSTKVPVEAIQLIEDTSYEVADEFFQMKQYLDVLIPRGSAGLIQNVVSKATVPVIETGAGNCHMFVDESAKEEMALNLIMNAKLQRPSVCNAVETVLIHEQWANDYGELLVRELLAQGTEVYTNDPVLQTEETKEVIEWETEFLREAIRLKVVASLDEALEHIAEYSTKHSEAIITEHDAHADRFLRDVDAAVVYHNASTRFTDGFEFGYGAEIGISTQKLHARGPMGLEALTSTKYIARGTGQARQ